MKDFIDLSLKDDIIRDLDALDYHDGSYHIDDTKGILAFIIPRTRSPWEEQRKRIRSSSGFTNTIKKYGVDTSKRNK